MTPAPVLHWNSFDFKVGVIAGGDTSEESVIWTFGARKCDIREDLHIDNLYFPLAKSRRFLPVGAETDQTFLKHYIDFTPL